jgi:hypothetical protein
VSSLNVSPRIIPRVPAKFLRLDVVWHNITHVRECFAADPAEEFLFLNFLAQKFTHGRRRSSFPSIQRVPLHARRNRYPDNGGF